ncbi:MAG: hypothetical protein IKQ10_06675 [Oscillospiraceae bacterium]|nr:hypothetical protein [Oscillospiraceae bacterium]
MAKFGWKSFIGGVLVGTVGLDILKAKEADEVYTAITEGVLVARDYVMKDVEIVSARAQDIYSEAKIRADRYLEKKKAVLAEEEFARGVDE